MEESDPRDRRNEAQRQELAQQFRQGVAHSDTPPPRLMKPPPRDRPYSEQLLSFQLYRRLDGLALNLPAQERKIDFGDSSGHINVVASNVELGDLEILIRSPSMGWDIRLNRENLGPEGSSPSLAKKPRQ